MKSLLIFLVAFVSQGALAQTTPDYKAWKQVKEGMTETSLIELLGPPEHGMRITDHQNLERADTVTQWTYWTLYPRSEVFPGGIYFSVWMRQGKVMGKNDPHKGVYSESGLPTPPILLLPRNGSEFATGDGHIIDLRWTPAAGKYPMQYDVELDISTGANPENWGEQNHISTEEPYLAVVRGGSQPHRWRVRAKNSAGVGEWSEYFYFQVKDQPK